MTDLQILVALAVCPPLLAALTARQCRRVIDALPPRAAALLLTTYALVVSLATGMMLCLLAYLGVVGHAPDLRPSDWSMPVVHRAFPIPVAVGVTLGVVAFALLAKAILHLARLLRHAHRSTRAAVSLPSVGTLAVVETDDVHAYAVGAFRHCDDRIVVTSGMLSRLTGPQRSALLAHERAHLAHRHHRYVRLIRLAAAANPLLRPACPALDSVLERWADDEAVHTVGDPAVVAHALGRAALASGAPGVGLAAAEHDVVARVRTLLEPQPRRARLAILPALAILACALSVGLAVLQTQGVIELSEIVARR